MFHMSTSPRTTFDWHDYSVIQWPNGLIYVVSLQWWSRYNVVSSKLLAAIHVIMQIRCRNFSFAKSSISQSSDMKTYARETTKLDSFHRRGKQLVLMSLLLCSWVIASCAVLCHHAKWFPLFLWPKNGRVYLFIILLNSVIMNTH